MSDQDLERATSALQTSQRALTELRQQNVHLLAFQDEANKLYRLSTAHDTERSRLRLQNRELEAAVARLEAQLQERDIRHTKELCDLSERLSNSDAKVSELSVERKALLRTSAVITPQSRTKSDKSTQQLTQLRQRASAAESERDSHKRRVLELSRKLADATRERAAFEQLCTARVDAAEARAAAHARRVAARSDVPTRGPTKAATATPAAASETALRAALGEVESLRGEVAGLRRAQTRLQSAAQGAERASELQELLAEAHERIERLQATVSTHERELAARDEAVALAAQQQAALRSLGGVDGVTTTLATLRRENEVLLLRALTAEEAAATASGARSAEATPVTSATPSEAPSTSDALQQQLELAQRRAAVASRECDGWRGIVESYAAGDALDAAAASRMALLETQLTEHKALTAQYASVLQTARADAAATAAAADAARSETPSRKRARVAEPLAADDESGAVAEVRDAALEAAAGAFDVAKLQVLRMVDNPLAQARRRLAEQRSGAAQRPRVNEALLATPRGHVYPVTPGGTIDADKRVQRLKEVFKAKIGAFREAVHVLFGYRMDMTDSQCRLLSQFAESEKHVLYFNMARDTDDALVLELLDSKYAKALGPELLAHLTQCNSIPAFLASHTLELFNNQTFVAQ